MAVPLLAIAVGAQVVSGLMQYYQSEKARGANNKRLKQIEEMFNNIVPPDLDIKVFDDPRVTKQIAIPNLDISAITPEMYKSVGQFVPAISDYVKESDPQLVKATEAANKGRGAQLDALEKYRSIASGGFDPQLNLKLQQASEKAAGDAQSQRQSILENANRRGVMGSGLQVASQMQNTSDSARRGAMESQMAAAEAYRNQLMALDKSANLGGDIRQSEMSEQGRNADIINAFNQRTRRDTQEWRDQRNSILNQANLRNLDTNQRIADANTGLTNKYNVDNRERWNKGLQQNYMNQQQGKNDIVDLAMKKNNVLQQMYDNQMKKASGRAGIGMEYINQQNKNTGDVNQTTQGIGNAVTMGSIYAMQNPDKPDPKPEYANPDMNYDDTGGQDQAGGNRWKIRPDQMRY